MKNVLRLIAYIVGTQTILAQPTAPLFLKDTLQLKTVSSLPKILKEASGLEITSSRLLWTHNDDRFAILYGLDTLGNVVKAIHLNHINHGWEDLTRDEDGNLYIGDFGNNENKRKDLAILKLPDPEKISNEIINAESIAFNYPDQSQFPPSDAQKNFDADAFVSIGDSLYIITKNRTQPFTGYAKIYRLPSTPGKYEALLYDSLYLGNGPMIDHWVTSADVSPDGKFLALLSHDCLWIVTDFKNRRFSAGKIFRIDLGNFSHKTGLCFASDTIIYIVDELEFRFLGGKLYALDLTETLGAILQTETGAR